jgi:hypothetical protein
MVRFARGQSTYRAVENYLAAGGSRHARAAAFGIDEFHPCQFERAADRLMHTLGFSSAQWGGIRR